MTIDPMADDARRLLRFLAVVAGFAAFILVIACLYWGQAILIPVTLALLLTFLLAPIVDLFQRIGLGRAVSVFLVVICMGVFVAGIGWAVMAQVTRLAYDLRYYPEYKRNITQKLDDLQGIGRGGLFNNLQATIDEIMGELDESTPPPERREQPLIVVREASSPLATLQATLNPLLEPLGAAALVVVLLIFMLMKYEDLRNRLISLVGPKKLTLTTRALADAGQRVSRYLLMQFIINSCYGAAISVGLFFLGVPYAVLWGFLAAVLRYIPYVGPWIGAFFPVTISLVAFSGWTQPGLVIGLVILLELGSNMIMEPWLYGQSIGVSQVGLLVVTGFWTWLWGPIGLVLAAPLTVCIVVLGRHVPQLRFFDVLLRDELAIEPPVIYYQRLLARDQKGAAEAVKEYIQDHSLEAVYDEVFIPALLLAWQDRNDGALDGEDEAFILEAMQETLGDLAANKQERKESENELPALVVALDRPGQAQVLIFGCPARHEAEEVIVRMLRQLMSRTGCQVEIISARAHITDIASRIVREKPALIFIAALPGGLPQTRYLCQYLHKEHPELHIVVGYWGEKEAFDKVLVQLRQDGASSLVTSLLQSRSRILALVEEVTDQPWTPEPDRQVIEAH